jgi:hypothetical protein
MTEADRERVRQRARHRCEYCRLPQRGHEERFSIDHVLAIKHGGNDDVSNLALACLRCNLHKGTDITSIDPDSGVVTEVFNPRTMNWTDHFETDGVVIRGTSPVGRVTVRLLQMNVAPRIQLRRTLTEEEGV